MTEEESKENFKKRYLQYSPKNILVNSLFMLIPLMSAAFFFNEKLNLKQFLFYAIMSLGSGILQIFTSNFLSKQGKLYVPPSPKYSLKSWKRHQEEKETKSIDV